jgi:hypothetical protein
MVVRKPKLVNGKKILTPNGSNQMIGPESQKSIRYTTSPSTLQHASHLPILGAQLTSWIQLPSWGVFLLVGIFKATSQRLADSSYCQTCRRLILNEALDLTRASQLLP